MELSAWACIAYSISLCFLSALLRVHLRYFEFRYVEVCIDSLDSRQRCDSNIDVMGNQDIQDRDREAYVLFVCLRILVAG